MLYVALKHLLRSIVILSFPELLLETLSERKAALQNGWVGFVFCFDEHWAPNNTNSCFLLWLIINPTFFRLLTRVTNVYQLALKDPNTQLCLFYMTAAVMKLWNVPCFCSWKFINSDPFFKWRSTSRQRSSQLITTYSRPMLPSNTALIIKTCVVEAALPAVHQWTADS